MNMGYVDVVLGLQWGDEGKGRIVHYLSRDYDLVVRFQGGANAGHTVYIGGQKYVLHLIPTGILHDDVKVAIGAGVVVDPEVLRDEINFLNDMGIEVNGRWFVDPRATVVFPFHKKEDALFERKDGIGSTKRGIAPAYRDLYQRFAIRVGDIVNDKHLDRILKKQLEFNNIILKHFGEKELEEDKAKEWLLGFREFFAPVLRDVSLLVKDYVSSGKKVLLEGAQGALLDVFFGNYPYVTSSHTVTGGALIGAGFGKEVVRRVYGVFKAYTTRVGKGPFPTELKDDTGEKIAELGEEYGATTGRRRRVGWLDIPLLKYSMWICGVTHPLMTKLDVLDGLHSVKLATSYRANGAVYDMVTPTLYELEKVEPLYETFGPFEGIKNARKREEFAPEVKRYISKIEELIGMPVKGISTGKESDLI